MALALALIVHALVRARGRGSGAMLDAAIPADGLGVVSLVLLAEPYAGGGSLAAVAYPLLDALYLAAFAWLVLLPSSRPPPLYLLGAGLAVLVLSDALYASAVAGGTYGPGHSADLGFPVAYTLWGAAALHPEMALLTEPGPPAPAGFMARGVVLVAAASPP